MIWGGTADFSREKSGERFPDAAGDKADRFVEGELFRKALVPRGKFADAIFEVAGADNQPERDSQQVGVREHDAGAHSAVIVEHLDAGFLQLFIQPWAALSSARMQQRWSCQGAMETGQMGP